MIDAKEVSTENEVKGEKTNSGNTGTFSSPGTLGTPGPGMGEEKVGYIPLPKRKEGEVFALVLKLHGGDQLKAVCDDGKERMCRITGKLKKKVWIREGDIIIVKIWDFQPIKGDVMWRYLGPQKNWLLRRGHLKNLESYLNQ